MRSAVTIFKATGGGVILNPASIASSVGLSDRFAYSMTKGSVLTMTYSVAKDYIADNIRCNCISRSCRVAEGSINSASWRLSEKTRLKKGM